MTKPSSLAAAAFLVAGAVSLGVASSQTKLWPVLIGAVLGIVSVAVSLLWVNDQFALVFGTAPPRWLKYVFTGVTAVGVVVIWVAATTNDAAVGVFATVIVAVAVIGWHAVRRTEHERPGEVWQALWRPFELIGGGVLVVWALDGFSSFAWLGLLVAMFGLIELKQTMASLVADGEVGTDRTLRWSIDASVAGVLAVLAGASTSNQLALLLGIAGVFGGLSVLGLTLVQVRCERAAGAAMALVGAVVLGVAWWAAEGALGSNGPAAVLLVLVAVVGAWFVWRGEGIILVVVIGFIAVWGMTDPASAEPLDPHPTSDVKILALGDSFISGEGADVYFPGTNQVGADRNECRRAPTAHPYLVADELEASLTFVACSGAKAADLTTCGQMATGDERCKFAWTDADRDAAGPVAGDLPQLANFTPDELQEFDVVLLSIGGNDVGFSTIVQACLLPRSCDERADAWLGAVDALGPTLIETYSKVRLAVGLGTPVIVVPYPLVVDSPTCDLGLDAAEHAFVQQFINRLDNQISRSAEAAGVTVYQPARWAFAGHRLCDREPAVNHIDLDPAGGSAPARYLPAAWIHNSMHPNPLGHELLAFGAPADPDDGLVAFVASALAGDITAVPRPVSPSTRDEAEADAAAAAREAVVADELLTDGQWIHDELYRTVRALLLPTVLALAGGFVLALGLANTDVQPFRLLRPRRTWRDPPGPGAGRSGVGSGWSGRGARTSRPGRPTESTEEPGVEPDVVVPADGEADDIEWQRHDP